ncbi:tripartite motif-containing protein 2-like [Lingula anatina]|uniref:Tripartite motif-containing protein 2-like n=1 Tax=Lingula anatina TaxID=7574 RepID=A0A1S3ITH3_LINAN|nr:tripartite motif-containing protein 2-like [Lingula anatina]|eukprot:XP_013401510.2 tripartite motif-containing protein 2-like [Lingula anatina]
MAKALAAALTDNILTCSTCLEEYQDPRVLPCYHTFCLACISDHAKGTLTTKRTFQCPVCREDVQFPPGGLSELKKNFAFCKAKDIINQQQTERGAPEAAAQLTNGCEKHPGNELKYYCEDDDTVVCGDCALNYHYRHAILPVGTVAKINREKIKTDLVKTVAKINIFKEAAREAANGFEDPDIMIAIINSIERQAHHVCRFINTKKDSLISDVKSAYDARNEQYEAMKDTLELHHASLQSACDFAKQLVANGTDSDIMAHGKSLTDKLTALENIPVLTTDTPAEVSYSPGEISTAELEAMLGQVTVHSKPPSAGQETHPRSSPNLPVFLEKVECVYSFTAKLKHDKRKDFMCWNLAIDEECIYVICVIYSENVKTKVRVFTHAGQFRFEIKLNKAIHVAVSQTGKMYVTSEGDKRVRVYSTTGIHITTMGQGQLENPSCIALNRQGHVVVCDVEKEIIFTFHADTGQLLNIIPLTLPKYPCYITVNSVNDNIVISDLDNCVHVLSPTGDHLQQNNGSGDGQLNGSSGLCTDSYGHIFIADGRNNRIVAMSPQGQFIKYVATEDDGLVGPRGLAINPAGLLVVAGMGGKVKTFKYLQ